jgi:3-oxoacyl-[acyl-carrier protein] reductase
MSKMALITGASSGLGSYLAEAFSQKGFSLQLVARRKNELEKVCDKLRQHKNSTVKSWVCDLADKSERSRFLNEFTQTCPHLDVLINSAACQGPIGPFETNDLEDWQNTLNLNLLAPVHICHQLLPLLKKADAGVIINISGGGATGPRPHFSAYASSKTALVRFSENLAEETRHFAIRVNCIAPGAMPTEMLRKVLEADKRNAGEKEIEQAKKVFSGPADVMEKAANLALFLASDESVGITGKLISAVWDRWEDWPKYLAELDKSDAYTLRRITGKDRGLTWGDR